MQAIVPETTLPPPFQAFFDAHRDDVWRFLVAVAGRQDADDCFQDTFLAALRAYGDLDDARNLRAWVMTIAYRKAVDSHRTRSRAPVPTERVPDAAVPPSADHDDELWHAVRELPPMQKGAVALRYVSDLVYRDVAAALGCSEDAARQNVRMGLKRLREVLAK